ncbi:MAG: cytochrome c-type biogenesis protein CcmH [Nitrospinae bacterium]|nr:cytochrome c-type biogenesis protein CcmH [Nitrospinota bacterium]
MKDKRQEAKISRKYKVGSMKRKILYFLLLTSYFLLLTPSVSAISIDEKYKPLYDDLSDKFMCLCGCGSTIKTCPMEECGFAIPFRKELYDRIQKGETKEQIINYFVGKHGQKILSAPTKKGFNLTAWITPFAAIIIVGLLMKKIMDKWTARQKLEDRSQKTEGVEDKYKKMLKKELEEFE